VTADELDDQLNPLPVPVPGAIARNGRMLAALDTLDDPKLLVEFLTAQLAFVTAAVSDEVWDRGLLFSLTAVGR